MRKLLLFFLCSSLGMTALIGCNTEKSPKNMDGFEVIHDTTELDQEIQDWMNPKKEKTGLYKKQFQSGSYLLISFGNRQNYVVKKIDITKENQGFLLNVTMQQSKSNSKGFQHIIESPILVKTDHIDKHFDVKIIYQ